jgi:hypothetical protein
LADAGASQEEIDSVYEPSIELVFEAAGVMIADLHAGATKNIEFEVAVDQLP